MNFLLFDLKRFFVVLLVLAIIVLSISFFAFLAIFLIPIGITILAVRKLFLPKKSNNININHQEYRETERNFIDVEYSKDEEKDI